MHRKCGPARSRISPRRIDAEKLVRLGHHGGRLSGDRRLACVRESQYERGPRVGAADHGAGRRRLRKPRQADRLLGASGSRTASRRHDQPPAACGTISAALPRAGRHRRRSSRRARCEGFARGAAHREPWCGDRTRLSLPDTAPLWGRACRNARGGSLGRRRRRHARSRSQPRHGSR